MGQSQRGHTEFDVVIVGGGIAGLSTALRLPEGMRVALFTKGQLGESNTRYAQGGIAVAVGEDDSPQLHFQDTLAAGAGLCDAEAVRVLVEEGPAAVHWLMQMGVQFDHVPPGEQATHATVEGLLLGREAAHSRWRVLHAGGDATGAAIEQALVKAVRERTSITLYEESFVQRLLVEQDVCCGVEALLPDGHVWQVRAPATVLASGGAGNLWLRTSNPLGATADGLALAWEAGAALSDLEFMQFHPTVLVTDDGSHLISEAVRGEGAYLRNHAGERFMPHYSPQAELAPRDVVARSILSEMLRERVGYEYLDLRHLPAEKMHARFPTISAICRRHGLDLTSDLLPVAPAAHYCMGGVMVDTWGRTTRAGLYAVGEVSCTGVHGANRLASNSLLEGLVYGLRVADSLSGTRSMPSFTQHARSIVAIPYQISFKHDRSSCSADEQIIQQIRHTLREVMWRDVSLIREEQGLRSALATVHALYEQLSGSKHEQAVHSWSYERAVRAQETINMLHTAELVIIAALQRRESCGSHWRSDYQESDERLAHLHYVLQPVQEASEVMAHV
jgi:L-aspartate oxidase